MQKDFSELSWLVEPSATYPRPRFDPIHVSASTFKAGLSVNIHRWFRLTPSFGPDLVREMMNQLQAQPGELVLDPFSGAGTTNIECSIQGLDSIGFEVNPLLHFVAEASTSWQNLSHAAAASELSRIITKYERRRNLVSFHTLSDHQLKIPPIHNPTRWWRPDVLTDLLVLKQIILEGQDHHLVNLFRLCLAGVLVPDLTNITLGRLQLHFIDRSRDIIDVIGTFSNHAKKMIDDLKSINRFDKLGYSNILLQDSTNIGRLKLPRLVDCVITSPPYPNRYSYVWNTRPHLYMLDFIQTGKDATDIDRRTIGGTWGTATSELMKGSIEPYSDAVDRLITPTVSLIRERDNLMANYAMHYFNRLARHIESIDPLLSSSARVAYVVGNSWLKGVYIETDILLGKLFESIGLAYTVTDIHRFRRRNSGKNLYESIVYARKYSI